MGLIQFTGAPESKLEIIGICSHSHSSWLIRWWDFSALLTDGSFQLCIPRPALPPALPSPNLAYLRLCVCPYKFCYRTVRCVGASAYTRTVQWGDISLYLYSAVGGHQPLPVQCSGEGHQPLPVQCGGGHQPIPGCLSHQARSHPPVSHPHPAYRYRSPGWSAQACPASVSCLRFLSAFSSEVTAVSLCLLSVPLVF